MGRGVWGVFFEGKEREGRGKGKDIFAMHTSLVCMCWNRFNKSSHGRRGIKIPAQLPKRIFAEKTVFFCCVCVYVTYVVFVLIGRGERGKKKSP